MSVLTRCSFSGTNTCPDWPGTGWSRFSEAIPVYLATCGLKRECRVGAPVAIAVAVTIAVAITVAAAVTLAVAEAVQADSSLCGREKDYQGCTDAILVESAHT